MKSIATTVTDNDYEFIKRAAKENGRTISEEIRHALKVYYAPDEKPEIIRPAGRHPRITPDGYYPD